MPFIKTPEPVAFLLRFSAMRMPLSVVAARHCLCHGSDAPVACESERVVVPMNWGVRQAGGREATMSTEPGWAPPGTETSKANIALVYD
jgi:hypothetical protein